MYERVLKERERLIATLADEVDYLRAQLAMRGAHVPGAAANPSEQPALGFSPLPLMEVKNHVSDEELDAEAIAASEGLNSEQIKEVIEAMGLVPEIDLDNITFG